MATTPERAGATRRGSRRTSISDVARNAGVSLGTVSNVLNRPERVSEGTRDRVQRAIEELSFVPNGSARQLRAGTITTVGAVLLDIGNPFFTEVARGIENRLDRDDYTLMLASSDGELDREARYLRLFEEHGVLGVLVTPAGPDLEHLLELRSRGVQVVLLDGTSPDPTISSVAVDDVAGAAMAVEHLLGLGHRRIGFINGPATIQQCVDRRAGMLRALDCGRPRPVGDDRGRGPGAELRRRGGRRRPAARGAAADRALLRQRSHRPRRHARAARARHADPGRHGRRRVRRRQLRLDAHDPADLGPAADPPAR